MSSPVRSASTAPLRLSKSASLRLLRAFEGQLQHLETTLSKTSEQAGGSPVLLDQQAKAIASLAKTLDLLMNLHRSVATAGAAHQQSKETNAAAITKERQDIDRMRRQLAQRLAQLNKP
ncbi:hypothetical protein [Polycladidibacter hongkongensis]|uniref:hypothetical protein n=1 Tax=Polycladidibacter hongkongensis TaxID=1647556 RepID=UPI000831AB62|nr:hypothetical protein [Pseudovibrio hongkongensis]